MDGASLLNILKWLAILLVPASALWGLLGSKPTYEREDGRKRLTRAGLVTVAIVTVAALGSAASFHYQTQIEEQDKARKAAEAKQAQRDKQTDARDRTLAMALAEITRANSVTLLVEQRARAAEERAERADARARDRELGEKVSVEAARNLARTGLALTQIERVQQPLEELNVRIVWRMDAAAPGLARIMAPALKKRADHLAWRAKMGFTPEGASLTPEDAEYPKFQAGDEQATRLRVAFYMLGARLILSPTPLDKSAFVARMRPGAGMNDTRGSLVLGIYRAEGLGELRYYYMPDGSVEWVTFSRFPLASLRQETAVISYPDLERAYGYLKIDRGQQSETLDPYVRIARIYVESTSRNYSIDGKRLREVYPDERHPGNFRLPALSTTKSPIDD